MGVRGDDAEGLPPSWVRSAVDPYLPRPRGRPGSGPGGGSSPAYPPAAGHLHQPPGCGCPGDARRRMNRGSARTRGRERWGAVAEFCGDPRGGDTPGRVGRRPRLPVPVPSIPRPGPPPRRAGPSPVAAPGAWYDGRLRAPFRFLPPGPGRSGPPVSSRPGRVEAVVRRQGARAAYALHSNGAQIRERCEIVPDRSRRAVALRAGPAARRATGCGARGRSAGRTLPRWEPNRPQSFLPTGSRISNPRPFAAASTLSGRV